jgi:peptide deformylase
VIRRVLIYPHPMLKRRCEPVTLATAVPVLEDLLDTMRAHPRCVGLAASQIGEPVQVAVVDVAGHPAARTSHGLICLINPRIEESAGRSIGREGCLSLPHITADIERAKRVVIATGPGPEPDLPRRWSSGFEARAIQHEVDHLSGILILDRVRSAKHIHHRATELEAEV